MNRIHSCMLHLVAVVAVLVSLPDGVRAQTPPAETKPQAESLEKLVTTLENDKARAELVEQIRALIAAQQRAGKDQPPSVGSRYLDVVATGLEELRSTALDVLADVADLPSAGRWLALQAGDPQSRQRWVDLLVAFVAVSAGGVIGYSALSLLVARWQRTIAAWQPLGALARTTRAAGFLLLLLMPVAAFAAGALAVLTFIELDLRLQLVVVAAINAVVVGGAILRVAHAVLAPAPDATRLWRGGIAEGTARQAFIWLRRLTILVAAGYFVVQIADLLLIPAPARRLLVSLVGLATATLVVAFVLRSRVAVAARLRGEAGAEGIGALRHRLADVWHVGGVIATLAIFSIWLLKDSIPVEFILVSGAKSVLVLVLAGVAMAGVKNMARRAADRDGLVARVFPRLLARGRRYVAPIGLLVRLAIAAIAAVAVLEVWGIGAVAWLRSPAGRSLSSTAFGLAVIAALAVVAWEAMSVAIERTLAPADGGARSAERDRRLRTLLPLVRTTANVALAAIVTMTVLAELGVNIGPLIAGAGVVGIAVGFGAQKLVQDVITGVFILMEDTISVGDVVDVGSHSGLVEALTIRSVRLRDLAGSVHTVPFSAVTSIVNMTKDFSNFVLDVGVSYREDTDQVVEVLREIDAEMRAEPEFAGRMIAPIEVLGVDRFADSAVIIKARLKTRPIEQWAVGREFNRRMKKRFDALGIEIPFPHLTMYFGADKNGAAPSAHLRLVEPEAGAQRAMPGGPAGRAAPLPADTDLEAERGDGRESRDGKRARHSAD